MMHRKFSRRSVLWALCLGLLLTGGLQPCAAGPGKQIGESTEGLEGVVNLNTATVEELARLPRVGESVAARIIEFREQNGSFKQAEDLMNVKGIGPKTFELLKPFLAVDGKTTLHRRDGGGGSSSGR